MKKKGKVTQDVLGTGCQVVDHAKQDPEWGVEFAENLCCGDCDKCCFYYVEEFLTGDLPIAHNDNYATNLQEARV